MSAPVENASRTFMKCRKRCLSSAVLECLGSIVPASTSSVQKGRRCRTRNRAVASLVSVAQSHWMLRKLPRKNFVRENGAI